jgi:hypothetical protein
MANTTIEFLSLTGLRSYDSQIKSFIESKVAEGDAKSFKYVNLVDRVLKFYTINPISDNTVPAYEIELPEQDVSHLMQLVKNATVGNVAVFGEGGQIVDTGIKSAELATKSEVLDVDAKADANASDITTMKSQIDALEKGTYDDTEVRGLIQGNTDAIKVISDDYLKKADKDELTGKINTAQTKGEEALSKAEEVAAGLTQEVKDRESSDARITTLEEQIVGLSGAMHFKGVKTSLPANTSGYDNGDVIIVENKEYVVNDGSFVEFGDVNAQSEAITDLTGRIDEADENIEQLQEDLDAAETALAKKAEQSDLNTEVSAREALDARVVVVEGKAHEHSNTTVLEGITSAKVAAWDAAKAEAIADAEAKNTALETALKKYADEEDAKIESRVGALETASATHALNTDVQAIAGRATTLESNMAQAQADIDAVEAKAAANEAAISNHATAIAGKAAQSDLNAMSGKVDNLETDVNALKSVTYVAITTDQINALFN